MFARGAIGCLCNDLFHRAGGGLSRAEAGRLDRARFQIPHRRGDAGAAARTTPPSASPSGEPVLVLHGTGGSAASMLTPTFAGELFGPGQPLDATKYYIIIPDAIGHGKSRKPSDGLKTKVPEIRLRRHGRRPVPAGQRGPRHQASAPRDRQFDGRHAHLDLGRRNIPTSWTRWCRWRRSRPRWRRATG